ncbi:MAG: TrkA family potassium uptake protein [Chloroflexi bacterium OHK40]
MRVLILGCSRIGVGLAQRLDLAGHTVTIVDPEPAALARLPASFGGRQLSGHVLDRRVLEEASIEHQDALAAVTPNDDVNIVAARLARLAFHVPRVVARLYSPRAATLYQQLGIQTVCTTTWGINRITELLSYAELEPVASIGTGVELLDAPLPPLLVGRPVSALARPGELQVVAISRDGRTFLPHPESRFESGDRLHLVVAAGATDHLVDLLRH